MRAFLVALLVLAFAPHSFGQITIGHDLRHGQRSNPGRPPGVDVVAKNIDTGLSRSAVTDANGYFTIAGLRRAPTKRAQPSRDSERRSSA